MTATETTYPAEQMGILTHALGITSCTPNHGRPTLWRNGYCSSGNPHLSALADAGLMKPGRMVNPQYGERMWHATEAGIRVALTGSTKVQTTVVSVRKTRPSDWEDHPLFTYVGRAVPLRGWKGSFWANRYRASAYGSAEACRRHEQDIRAALARVPAPPGTHRGGVELLWDAVSVGVQAELPKLRGRVLGCWCGDWRPGQPEIPCHAVTLAKLADLEAAR